MITFWPIQKLINRAAGTQPLLGFFHGLNLDGQVRVRANLNSLCVPLRALPSSPLAQLIDEELVWIMLDRLGIKHPEAAGIRKCPSHDQGGRHALRCKTGTNRADN